MAHSTGILALVRLGFRKKDLLIETLLTLGIELQTYYSGLIDAGVSRIPKTDATPSELPYHGSVKEHLRLLDISEKIVGELIKAPIIQQVASPTTASPGYP